MRISPDIKDKFRKFRKNKRSYYSLIALLVLFAMTLPAELVFNDRPVMMSVEGKWFFPHCINHLIVWCTLLPHKSHMICLIMNWYSDV